MVKKGLTCYVYRCPLGECTNNGVTSEKRMANCEVKDTVLLIGNGNDIVEGPTEVESAIENLRIPILILDRKTGILRAIPMGDDGIHWMFGGNFIYCSDSRFPMTGNFKVPIPVHDRREY